MIEYLPMTVEECTELGWKELDIIIVTGDAYIDHHAFGAAIIGRYLTAKGFKVGIIAQPDFHSDKDFLALGKPRLFFGVTAGNIDSMVNHYTAQKKIRTNDSYSPDGKAGLRPDRATIVYTQKLQQYFKDTPVIIGGIEASLRRIPHYDFLQDKIRNSILLDSKAAMLIYGMAEKTILQLAKKLASGQSITDLKDLPGTVVTVSELPQPSPKQSDSQSGGNSSNERENYVVLPSYEESVTPDNFLKMNRLFFDHFTDKTVYQQAGTRCLKHNPPEKPLTESELDFIYNLPFSRKPHPVYAGKKIPAYEQIKESITSHRGCFGGCNFCSLYFHQGKKIISRSKKSIMREIDLLTLQKSFSGTITDIGGPSANMYGIKCSVTDCKRPSCLKPAICPQLDTSHKEYLQLLKMCRSISGVKHLFVSSGVRTDLATQSKDFMADLVSCYTGGRIKVAPEHISPQVLQTMNKQDLNTYEKFCRIFTENCRQYNKRLEIIPYIMVGHPGSTIHDAVNLAIYLKKNKLRLEQIQEFTPTPMTVSTAMYYSGKDFFTGKSITVPKGREIRLQKALAQWFIPANKKYVLEALKKAGRTDLKAFFFDK